ncbi:MAG TPA: cytochrome B [Cytophagales bacterium]|nr:cytochrome B [Cytophagales bacterium]
MDALVLGILLYFSENLNHMNSFVLILHSANRFILLALLLLVIVRAFNGWQKKSAFEATDNKLGLFLFISTHTQLLLGLILYFISPAVVFSGESMKDSVARYWLVEHISGMFIAIVLITMARITAKKMTDDTAKHKRLFTFNLLALVIVAAMIALSHRGFFTVTW